MRRGIAPFTRVTEPVTMKTDAEDRRGNRVLILLPWGINVTAVRKNSVRPRIQKLLGIMDNRTLLRRRQTLQLVARVLRVVPLGSQRQIALQLRARAGHVAFIDQQDA